MTAIKKCWCRPRVKPQTRRRVERGDRIWEFAYGAFIADGEREWLHSKTLELAFDNIVDHAKIAEGRCPRLSFIRRYAVRLTTWKAGNFCHYSAHTWRPHRRWTSSAQSEQVARHASRI